jgi:MerR family transcriptional regulator, heat shock protein HspR
MDYRDDVRVSQWWLEFEPEEEPNSEPRYAVTAVASQIGVHVQTIYRYEQYGLVQPRRLDTGSRLYSEADIEQLRRIRRLTEDLGVNLAGVAAVLHLRRQLVALQREMAAMRRQRG